MANELRVTADGVAGVITDNPLASGATTMNSAALADLPAIGSTQYAKITLFARDSNGRITSREVVHVTSHTAAATSATILRGQEGTTAASWASGSSWVHGPTARDFPGSGVKVYKSAGQSVSANTQTNISFDLEEFDTDNYHDNTTNNTRLTVPGAGLYLMGYCIGSSTTISSTSLRFLGTVYKNGDVTTGAFVPGSREELDINSTGAFPAVNVTFPVFAAAGDYFTLGIYSTSAFTADQTLCDFWMIRLNGK